MRNGSYLFIALWVMSILPVTVVIATLWRRYVPPIECLGLLFVLCFAFIFTVGVAATAFLFDEVLSGVFATLAVATFIGSFVLFVMDKWRRADTVAVVIYYATMVASITALIAG